MVTGGAESVFSYLPISGFANMKALSRNLDPAKASCPFNSSRDGFVMSEGAGILVLENLEKAQARGAKIYAELVSMGTSSDAFHITAPEAEGKGASRCIQNCLEMGGVAADRVGYVNAHGTSTPLGDIAETMALKRTFGGHAKNLKVSSTKSMIGHLLGAAGGMESIFCIQALHTGILPPTINLHSPDPSCDLDYIPNLAQKKEVEFALNNSFGFGGTNCSLLFKRYER
jgi:3-oxoacyl-[acyl-carrier-protein] synthase II